MAFDTSLLTDYTFAQIKLAAKHAMLSAAVGGATLIINGRTISRVTLKEARDLYDWADTLASIEGDETGGIILGSFGEPA